MDKAVSNRDLVKYCKEITYHDYNDLYPTMSLRKLFGKYNALALLLRPNGPDDVGHWVFLQLLSPHTVEYFDPLGYDLDEKEMTNGSDPVLSRILLNRGIQKIVSNDDPLQFQDNKIQTCGRHVAMRCLLREIPLQRYVHLLTGDGLPPDFIVTLFTKSLTS